MPPPATPPNRDKPLPELPRSRRPSRELFSALRRLPAALQAKRAAGLGLHRRAAVRIKVVQRETFVMQPPTHASPSSLPDPAYLGNRLLVGEKDRRSLARAPLLAHFHPLAPIPEDLPFANAFFSSSSSTLSTTLESGSEAGCATAPSSADLLASPKSYFSDDSSDEDDDTCSWWDGDRSDDDEEGQDFPTDEVCPIEEDSGAVDDEDLASDFDMRSFVSKLEEDQRRSRLFSSSTSSSTCPSSPSSSLATSPPVSPATTPARTLSPIPYRLPPLSGLSSPSFTDFDQAFPPRRPHSFTALYPGVGSDGTYDLDDFDFRVGGKAQSPCRSRAGRTGPGGRLNREGAVRRKKAERRGSTRTV
ncbi:hypothetical protein JCM8097_003671 [Rhodosporidiobolus ruineniae]